MAPLSGTWYHEQFRFWWGIIVAYTWCAYDDILERIVYPAFLLTLPWPRLHPWVGREWSFTGTDGNLFCWWPCPVGDFCLVLVGDRWFWSMGSKSMTVFYGSRFRIHAEVPILCFVIHSQPAIVSSFCIIACLFSKKIMHKKEKS
jgi:hypothetical protein